MSPAPLDTGAGTAPAATAPAADGGLLDIQLDGRPYRVAPCTLAQLVAQLGHAGESVGTALNGRFVPRGQREVALRSGDAVLFFKPIVGG